MKSLFTSLLAFIVIMAFSTTALRAQTDDTGDQTILQLATETPELSTLVAALNAADLASTLEGDGPFTVFAPTNDAFRALPQEVFNALLKAENRDALVEILKYHVADGNMTAEDVMTAIDGAGEEGYTATTMGGDFTATSMDGGVMLTDGKGTEAMVTQADIVASNGVIHLIDHVLIPADLDVDALTSDGMGMNNMEDDMKQEGQEMAGNMETNVEQAGQEAAATMNRMDRDTMKGMANEAGQEMNQTMENVEQAGQETAATMNRMSRDTMQGMARQEGQTMGNKVARAGEEAAQDVKRTAQEVGNDVSRAAQKVGNEVSETARDMTGTERTSDMTTRTKTGSYSAGNTIVDVATKNGDFKTLVSAIDAAELSDLLGSDGDFTVFAPNDEAFNKLPSGTVSDLTQSSNKEKLQGILSYHVIASRISAADLMKAIEANKGYFRIQTISGESLIASMEDGNVILTDGNGNVSTVTATDVEADNGVIHVIDTVLMPKTSM